MKNRISKDEWVSMFRETGLDEAAMMRWHHIFETRHPDAHADFLAWLGIGPNEIARIRTASRKTQNPGMKARSTRERT